MTMANSSRGTSKEALRELLDLGDPALFPRYSAGALIWIARTPNADAGAYIRRMPRKQLELPRSVARDFVRDMRAFHAEKSPLSETRSLVARSMSCGDSKGSTSGRSSCIKSKRCSRR
jgi:hypothetical protein